MKIITLTQNKITKVSDCDYTYLSQWNWCLHNQGYAVHSEWPSKKIVLMHRVILSRKLGHSDFVFVDHEDLDRLNNQRSNLRPASRSQNEMNKQGGRGLSNFKGVSWHKKANKWRGYIKFDSKQIHLGLFIEEQKAAKAYNRKAVELFGNFAYLNELS